MQGLRIGIDVGGTFTHGVLLRPPGELLKRCVTPTTHSDPRGVAAGIATVLARPVRRPAAWQWRELVAHSTTQATNALLEGDVSPVNLIVLIPPGEGLLLHAALRARSIPTGSGRGIPLNRFFLPLGNASALAELSQSLGRGIPTAVIQPLAGRQQSQEADVARALGLEPRHSVLASEISQVLGLQARARTAAINAAMLPRMLETADFTQQAVTELLPGTPLQVVRSDGGAMDISELRRQPILSILSGPAAGASAALHRSGLSELAFIEVGGTSTDITLVRSGRVRHRNATVGGNRLLVPALDLRTAALGGGSMLDAQQQRFGPRSAHIAGLPYLFQVLQRGESIADIDTWQDSHGQAYLVLRTAAGAQVAYTLTDQALAAAHAAQRAPELLAQLGIALPVEKLDQLAEISQRFIARGATAFRASLEEPARLIRELMRSHEDSSSDLVLLAGGGGGPVILGSLAEMLGLRPLLIADHAVISAVGAALAVTCVSLSRSTAEPRVADIEELTREVEQRLQRQGAERVSTDYDFDAQRQVLTVTGRGNRPYDQAGQALAETELAARAAELLPGAEAAWQGSGISLYCTAPGRQGRRRGVALASGGRALWQGGLRRQVPFAAGEMEACLEGVIASSTQYTDGGALLPGLRLLAAGRCIPLDQLGSAELLREVLRWENLPRDCSGLFVLD